MKPAPPEPLSFPEQGASADARRAPSEPEYAAAPKAATGVALKAATGVAPKATTADVPSEDLPPEDLPSNTAQQRRQKAARRMGQARTEAKRLTARQNARRGGRPQGYVVSAETRRKISEAKIRRSELKNVADDKANEQTP